MSYFCSLLWLLYVAHRDTIVWSRPQRCWRGVRHATADVRSGVGMRTGVHRSPSERRPWVLVIASVWHINSSSGGLSCLCCMIVNIFYFTVVNMVDFKGISALMIGNISCLRHSSQCKFSHARLIHLYLYCSCFFGRYWPLWSVDARWLRNWFKVSMSCFDFLVRVSLFDWK